jgi:hypothetical protein
MNTRLPSRTLVALSMISLLFVGFQTAFAQPTIPEPGDITAKDAQGMNTWTLVPAECLGPDAATECGFNEMLQLVANIIGLFMVIALLLAGLLFGYAGFLYVTTAGDPGKAKKARGIFTNVAIGLVIVFLAYTIVQVIISILV